MQMVLSFYINEQRNALRAARLLCLLGMPQVRDQWSIPVAHRIPLLQASYTPVLWR